MNFTQFINQIELTDFTMIRNLNCPTAAYNLFISLYQQCFDTAFSIKQIKPNKPKDNFGLWWDNYRLVQLKAKYSIKIDLA